MHYVAYGTPGGEYKAGAHRAAIITATYHGSDGRPPQGITIQLDPDGVCICVGLCILNPTGMFFTQGVHHDADGAPGTWHWPERV